MKRKTPKIPTLQPDLWVDKYANYLFSYAYSRVSNQHLAKDLVQDTFMAALQSRNSYKAKASEKTWLVSILKRKIIDHYRKISTVKAKSELKFNNERNTEEVWLDNKVSYQQLNEIEVNIEAKELQNLINNCLESLPKKQALIFKLKTIHGIDSKEICKEFNISPSNLWVIVHRTRVYLKKCIEKKWFNN